MINYSLKRLKPIDTITINKCISSILKDSSCTKFNNIMIVNKILFKENMNNDKLFEFNNMRASFIKMMINVWIDNNRLNKYKMIYLMCDNYIFNIIDVVNKSCRIGKETIRLFPSEFFLLNFEIINDNEYTPFNYILVCVDNNINIFSNNKKCLDDIVNIKYYNNLNKFLIELKYFTNDNFKLLFNKTNESIIHYFGNITI